MAKGEYNMIKVGIVGARGFSVVGAMKAMPDEVKITAMCDLDEDCLNRAKEEIGLEESQCYRIYDDMLEKADIDAVVISTPMQCHVPQAILALQAGKHVMCRRRLLWSSKTRSGSGFRSFTSFAAVSGAAKGKASAFFCLLRSQKVQMPVSS